MTQQPRSVQLSADVTLEYLEQGRRGGVPAVFLHGIGDSCRAFDLVREQLPRAQHAYFLSQRGHGGSSRPRGAYRYYDFAADLAAFLRALELDGAVVVGHSLGSTIAQRFAIDCPELTRGLVLTGAFHNLPGNKAPRELWGPVTDLHDPVDEGFIRRFHESGCQRPVPRPFLEECILPESRKVPARVWQEVVGWAMQDEFQDELGRISAPTLLVWGDRDPLVPGSDQDALLRAIPDSRLITYAGHGHALAWEAPERLAQDFVEFVEQLG